MLARSLARVVLNRLFQALLVAFALATLCFVFIYTLPGDMALRVAIARFGLDQLSGDLVDSVRREGFIETPLLSQYLGWLGHVFTGNFGQSLVSDRPVSQELARAGANTFTLAGLGWAASYVIALPLGLWAGLHPGGVLDRATAAVSAVIASLPSFLIGIGLIWVFSIALGWLPPAGNRGPHYLILPAAALALGLAALSVRVIRNAIAANKDAFHVTFSRVRGLTPGRAFTRHVMRNAGTPIATFAALQFAILLDGFVVIETLFNYPGLGDLLVKALISRDVPVIMGGALLIGYLFAAVSLVSDLICLWLDPRQTSGGLP